jgi:ComF family protein
MKTFWGKVNCKSASAIYQFHTKSPLQRLIHELKYNNNTIIGIELGQLCGLEIQNNLNFKTLEAIVPIPLHKAKKALRGYNQCDFIAEGLSQILQTEVRKNLFKRTRNNPSQTQKNKYERWKNSEQLFELNQELPRGEWLLIDDIFTTGSTITSCIEAVPVEFHNKINVLTVGYAP